MYPIAKKPKVILIDAAGNRLIKDSDGKIAVVNKKGAIVNTAGMKSFAKRAKAAGYDIRLERQGKKTFMYGEEIERAMGNNQADYYLGW